MSSFNETISLKTWQSATGSVGTSAAQLVDVLDKASGKGIIIKNTHASQKLYIGDARVSATKGFELGANESVELALQYANEVYVVGGGASTTYTWLSY